MHKLWLIILLMPVSAMAADGDGIRLYRERCASCHDMLQDRMPTRAALREFAPENIIASITTGAMQSHAVGLTSEQQRMLAEYLSAKPLGQMQTAAPKANMCTQPPTPLDLESSRWNGWGNDIENTRVQMDPGLSPADVSRLKLKWAYAYPGRSAYGQPTVVGNRVFVTSMVGQVSALDTLSGCAHWIYDAGAGVKTAMTIAAAPVGVDAKTIAYFGDEKAFVHAVDADTGKLLWRTRLDLHVAARVTGAPTLHKDLLYVPLSSSEEDLATNKKYACCTFRGSLSALEVATGTLVWKTYTIDQEPKPYKKNAAGTQLFGPAGVSIWGAPTIDAKRGVIYVGTGNSYTEVATTTHDGIMAFDLKTGARKWARTLSSPIASDKIDAACFRGGKNICPHNANTDNEFGAAIILKTLPNGKPILLAGQKSGIVYALDTDKGKTLWQTTVGSGSALGGIEWGMAADNEHIYVAISDILNQKMPMPGLTALKLRDGDKAWYVPTPNPKCSFQGGRCARAQSAAVSAMPGAIFSGAYDGYVRAYSSRDGTVLWEFDTGQTFNTVNGISVSGGNIDGGGATVANGMLFVNSGYASRSGGFGRLMLVFDVAPN